MAVNPTKRATPKSKTPTPPRTSSPKEWARAVWKGVFGEGMKTTEVSRAQLPKALRTFQHPYLQIAREGWVEQAAALPVKFEKGTFEGKAFYLVSVGAEHMLYDASGKDLLSLMSSPAPQAAQAQAGWSAK